MFAVGYAPSALTHPTRLRTLPQRRLDELHRILARPVGGAGDGTDLAAVRIDQQRGRHAEGAADTFQILEALRARVGVIRKMRRADVLEKRLRLLRIARV